MAVIEISKIQVRRGQENQTNLPILDAGEFGWATDTQRLYIGNGDPTVDGAPLVGNTEIVTAGTFANFFQNSTVYVYGRYIGQISNQRPSTLVVTGPNNSSADTQRALASKLDDTVSVADFGVVGNGNPYTETGIPVYQQIQQAIDETFSNITNETAKKLLIPAGTYVITGTIYVPPFANIVGDGANTVLQCTGRWENTGTGYAAYTGTSIFQFVGVDAYGTYKEFNPLTGEGIPSTGQPTEINLENLHFTYENSDALYYNCEPLVRADCAIDSKITKCKFEGHSRSTGSEYYAAIEIRAQGAVRTENLQITDNVFYNIRHGVVTNYDNVQDTLISNNRFNYHRTGISHFSIPATGQQIGPYRSKFIDNNFTNIDRQAIYIGTPTGALLYTNHISMGNSFENTVGNGNPGNTRYPQTAVIQYGSKGNITSADKFERDEDFRKADNDAYVYLAPISGSIYYEPNVAYIGGVTLSAIVPATLIRVPFSGVDQLIKVQYNLSRTTVSRKGELLINVSTGIASGSTATITESYTYYGADDGNITFGVSLNETNQTVKVIYNSPSPVGTLEYKYSYLG